MEAAVMLSLNPRGGAAGSHFTIFLLLCPWLWPGDLHVQTWYVSPADSKTELSTRARTFGYLKTRVPDGYWNRYPGTCSEHYFLCQGFQNSLHLYYIHTYIHT